METHVLASGSTGNAIFLDFGKTKLLIDAGISARRIKNALDSLGVAIEDLDAVLITHEHRDHVSGLRTLMHKYRLPVYARQAAWAAMPGLADLPPAYRCVMPESLYIGEVLIKPFSISHDASDPVGYTFYCRGTKCTIATDLGFVTDTVKQALALSDVLVLEANHDAEMLRTGSYPWHLKRRIMSNRGHLSNVDAAWALARMERKRRTHVFLAHLSQENNRPDIAKSTISAILTEQGLKIGEEIELHLTYPDTVASLVGLTGE